MLITCYDQIQNSLTSKVFDHLVPIYLSHHFMPETPSPKYTVPRATPGHLLFPSTCLMLSHLDTLALAILFPAMPFSPLHPAKS